MNLACQILASFLLIFVFYIKGEVLETKLVWGALGHDFDLDSAGFQMNAKIDHIRWEKGKTKVAELKTGILKDTHGKYNISTNGFLKIKHLMMNDSDIYKVAIYDKDGKSVLRRNYQLKIQEKVSTPKILWSCGNQSLTCEITSGTDPTLMLYVNQTMIKNLLNMTIVQWNWTSQQEMTVSCTAKNEVSQKREEKIINCSEKGLDIYLIVGICGGGTIFIIFMTLLIFYINKRKKQNSRRNDEELGPRAHRVTTKEKGRKPRQFPGSTPPNPAVSQPPPPPSHRAQAPCHRPPPPSHRVQHHQQKKPPAPSATQVHQQKGPPLPRPRVQPKPPHGATESS
ncbi:T-cell surface antigen CD2 [Lycaon pictus]|nr:T-cell surface antigen CD2 [Canis lupus dingo]XP_038417805.1 T-cell surface antigen CD2 [Canis lupus familiaris]XP_038547807.1 T-cell surface antigen CD2 [Canis lupus familiaris]XP_849219.1 T-cell surface antigen CD2 [Canis lupus familiaris]|eukprot:XP_849219.1 T-cell surface antigen CD2 [Canis lupus familiaris]